jgi:hypothetical protein
MSETTHKYQKLASAIYLITSFFTDQEPLKWRLRSLSADLVSEGMKDKGAVSREIISFFGVAKAAGIVSQPNHDILAQELGKLIAEAEQPLALLFKNEAKTETPLPPALPVRQAQSTPEQAPEPDPEPSRELLPQMESIKDTSLKEYGAVSVKKNSRQSVIIGLLKRKKEIMIKDVSPLISGCSEKTIQRELSEMVTAGVLKRIGEKRWTRYSLA